jgi:hypothetical protein
MAITVYTIQKIPKGYTLNEIFSRKGTTKIAHMQTFAHFSCIYQKKAVTLQRKVCEYEKNNPFCRVGVRNEPRGAE